jgi:glycosyltransferase involved in cell wall biosynthesis/SAM-dependent methyltransferase
MVEGAARNRRTGSDSAVAVVITTYNHARFLGEAIESVLAQIRPAADILIVDDGSTDDPGSVVARYPGVRLMQQANQGLSSARNAGLRNAKTDKLIFLDADDRLLPNAVAAGLSCFANAPASGFVYGGYRRVWLNGRSRSANYYNPISADPYRDFLKGNLIGMHAAVMYDRAKLVAIGGFDPALRRCEDYDIYLRMSRSTPVASHPEIIAEYRWHGTNISGDHREMLDWSLRVHRQEVRHALKKPDTARAWRRGRRRWRNLYVSRMLADAKSEWADHHSLEAALRGIKNAISAAPLVTARFALGLARRRLTRRFSAHLVHHRQSQVHGELLSPPLGSVNLGDLDRITPISADFGFDRGTPVDRYYIERFVERCAADIGGRVLEVRDDSYCRRFAAARITRQDVLDLSTDNAAATIVGDLCDPHTLPSGAFDCLLLTQTLHLIFDLRTAVVQMHRALRAGGVVLLTVPGISQIDRGASRDAWCWSLTPQSMHRLFSEVFGSDHVRVESHGNVYAATAFLQGLAVEDVDRARLDFEDVSYPVIVTVRAQKARAAISPQAPDA